jgi:hypothetical protein
LRRAACCHEGLGNWEEAEQYFHAVATRYRGSRLQWYFFCRRTGQGDLDAARQWVRDCLKEPTEKQSLDLDYLALFYLLEQQRDKAMQIFREQFIRSDNPYMGLHVALLAADMDKPELCDKALKRIDTHGNRYILNETNNQRHELIALARMFADDLAKGGKGEIDLAAADKLCPAKYEYERINFNYYLAKYLAQHGQENRAVEYWKRCTATYRITDLNRTLAAAELIRRGHAPNSYRTVPASKKDTERQDESQTPEKTP